MHINNGYHHGFRPTDRGPKPYVVNIEYVTTQNQNYRTALWTGHNLQTTLMSIIDEIGLEVHHDTDQFIRIEEGYGLVVMGPSKDSLNYRVNVGKNSAVFVPAGTWHNVINRGNTPIKLYSIYAPPHHPYGTVQRTREEAAAEGMH